VTRSLRRTLAVRFAATMGAGLLLAAAAAYAVAIGPTAGMHRELLVVLAAVVVLGTGATLVGAWWLAGSAVRPVHEITEQATRIEAGTLHRPIAAHAETAEYRGLVAVLNRMLERLDLAFRNQRRLTADVSHELRTPLTAMKGEIEVALRAERTPRDYQHVLHSALEEIEQLTEMSDDLLLITRADAGLLRPGTAPTDLNAVIECVLRALKARIEQGDLRVERFLLPEGAEASLDAALITRVAHHLIDNAVKFTPRGGTIRIATSRMGEHMTLSVEDSGPGIAADHLPHIFEPFYRIDEARTRGSGTGLGLAMVAAIVRLHGGTIRASNVQGRSGARFDVELPNAIPNTLEP
jgi:heavy metal sensor kinase